MHENVSNSAGTKEKDGLVYGVLKRRFSCSLKSHKGPISGCLTRWFVDAHQHGWRGDRLAIPIERREETR